MSVEAAFVYNWIRFVSAGFRLLRLGSLYGVVFVAVGVVLLPLKSLCYFSGVALLSVEIAFVDR